ncbi:hypothetical protein [Desulfobulbus propionicus]
MNELRINRSLAEISTHVRNLHHGALGDNADLLAIMHTTKSLRAEMTSDRILDGYKTDAINQALWVAELIQEAGTSPDHKTLLSIGMACELATLKLNEYRELHAFASQVKASTLEQLAA